MSSETVIKIQKSLSAENFNQRINEICFSLEEYKNTNNVIFDLMECDYISPTGIVFLQMFRDALKEQGSKTFAKIPEKRFLKRFLKTSGLIDLSIQEDKLLSKYTVKITRCNSVDACLNLQKDIMSKVIDRFTIDASTYAAIDYMVAEIWDNSGTHGYGCYETIEYPKPIYICTFSYTDKIEIVIGDRGLGIVSTLRQNNEKLSKLPSKDIMLKSIENTISGHPNGSPGFGLYCASEFLRKGKGALNIFSSKYHLRVSNKRTKIMKSKYDLGTLVSFTVFKTAQIPFKEIIGRDADEQVDIFIDGVFL